MAVSPAAMKEQEIDALVARVGDEILARLGSGHGPGYGLSHGPVSASEPAPVEGWESPSTPLEKRLDLDLTAPEATADEVGLQSAQASAAGLRAVWTCSSTAPAAERALRGSATRLGVVVGFPHGSAATPAKVAEAETAVRLGACEVETLIQLAAARADDWDAVFADLNAVAGVVLAAGRTFAVALEPALLDPARLVRAAVVSHLAGARAVRVSTGYNTHQAPRAETAPEAITRLRSALSDEVAVVAGGVRSFGLLTRALRAGAARAVMVNALDMPAKSRS